jgi:glycerol-3-phosphate acyltransferase PlsY
MIYIFGSEEFNGLLYGLFEKYRDTAQTKAFIFFLLGILACVFIPYLLGSLNASIITSKYMYQDDIRNYGSGNAGLTNMYRIYGKKGAIYTLAGDILKQILSVLAGVLVFGINGAFLAGIFCMIGHIFPVFYRFKGGKGVLTAATMILLIDPLVFLVLFSFFVLIVLLFRYISLASMMAGFIYPALIYYRFKILGGAEAAPPLPYMLFAVFIGLLIIFMHRENMRRIYHNEENRFSFKRKKDEGEEAAEESSDALASQKKKSKWKKKR